MILLRMGIIPHTYVKSIAHQNRDGHKIDGRIITAKHDKYEIEVTGPWLQKMSEYLGVQHHLMVKRKRTNYFGWFQDGYAVIPIRGIKKEQYDGLVYNLAVGDDNSGRINDKSRAAADLHFFLAFWHHKKAIGSDGHLGAGRAAERRFKNRQHFRNGDADHRRQNFFNYLGNRRIS